MLVRHWSRAALGFLPLLLAGTRAYAPQAGGATALLLPQRQTLAASAQNAWAHVECSPAAPANYDKLTCQIGTLEVVREDTPDATAEPGLKAAERQKLARSHVETRSSFATSELGRLAAGTATATPEHQAYWSELADIGEQMGAASDASATQAAWAKMRAIEVSTCRIGFGGQELAFARTGENQWTSNAAPQGSCGERVVHVLDLERQRETPEPSWRYTRRTVAADLDRFPWCRAIQARINRPEIYGVAANHGIAANCKYVTVDTVW